METLIHKMVDNWESLYFQDLVFSIKREVWIKEGSGEGILVCETFREWQRVNKTQKLWPLVMSLILVTFKWAKKHGCVNFSQWSVAKEELKSSSPDS